MLFIIIVKETRLLTYPSVLHNPADLLSYAVEYIMASVFSILILKQDSPMVYAENINNLK